VLAKLAELLAQWKGQTPAGAPAGAGSLAPTPLNPNVEGQQAKINTIQNRTSRRSRSSAPR